MCLIAYVPAGKILPEENARAAHAGNNDGIGVMSMRGVQKFLGKKSLKKALRYIRELQADSEEFAVHFRFATHGAVIRSNAHPFQVPGADAYVMHNGVLRDFTAKSTVFKSDTSLFVDTLDATKLESLTYWDQVGKDIGWSNKLCVLLPSRDFILVNEDAGDWIDGVWYSQTYSLPSTVDNKWWEKYMDDKYKDGATTDAKILDWDDNTGATRDFCGLCGYSARLNEQGFCPECEAYSDVEARKGGIGA
jgi:hypothetical protein